MESWIPAVTDFSLCGNPLYHRCWEMGCFKADPFSGPIRIKALEFPVCR